MSPKKKKKIVKRYKKERKNLILTTLKINEKEYKQIMKAGDLLCRYTDLVQGGEERVDITEKDANAYIGTFLSLFAVYGSLSLNPMESVLYALSKSLQDMSAPKKDKEENVTRGSATSGSTTSGNTTFN